MSQSAPSHPLLPCIPLPLPLHVSKSNSHTALSLSGLKTGVRTYIRHEEAIADRLNAGDQTVTECAPYLRVYLADSDSSADGPPPARVPEVSPVFRLAMAAQFQHTAAQHLVSKLERVVHFLEGELAVGQYVAPRQPPPVADAELGGRCARSERTGLRALGDPAPPATEPETYGFPVPALPDEPPCESVEQEHRLAACAPPLSGQAPRRFVMAGGVACNSFLRHTYVTPPCPRPPRLHSHVPHSIFAAMTRLGFENFPVPPSLCTDNGTMIAWAGVQALRAGHVSRYIQSSASMSCVSSILAFHCSHLPQTQHPPEAPLARGGRGLHHTASQARRRQA
jgi:tRNA A37 threonylcarbamoyltransferase TsaD